MKQCIHWIEEMISENRMITLQAIVEELVSILGQLERYWMACCTPESLPEDAQRGKMNQIDRDQQEVTELAGKCTLARKARISQ